MLLQTMVVDSAAGRVTGRIEGKVVRAALQRGLEAFVLELRHRVGRVLGGHVRHGDKLAFAALSLVPLVQPVKATAAAASSSTASVAACPRTARRYPARTHQRNWTVPEARARPCCGPGSRKSDVPAAAALSRVTVVRQPAGCRRHATARRMFFVDADRHIGAQ